MIASLYSNSTQTVRIFASLSRRGFRKCQATAQAAIDEKDLYHIGDVSRLADVKAFVLRYWESEFPMLQPLKSSGGRRLYRQEDVDMVFRIKRLLYDEGFTIAGAQIIPPHRD